MITELVPLLQLPPPIGIVVGVVHRLLRRDFLSQAIKAIVDSRDRGCDGAP